MAIIAKIRNRQGLLVALIGLAMLLFVVDPSTIFSKLTGGGEQPIGEIFGEQMLDSKWKYELRVENASNNYRYQKQQAGQDPILNDQETEQVKGQVWSQMIIDTLFNHELAKLGIVVSPEELNESLLYGMNPATYLKQMFSYGEEGNKVFIRDSLLKTLNRSINNANQETKRQLKNLEDQIIRERIREKYLGMIKYGLTGTTEDANRTYAESNTKVAVKYFFKDYNSISDTVISVTDEDLKAYFDKHQFEKKWKQEVDLRSFKYVTFDILPSNRDISTAINRLSKSKKGFEVAENDSLYVANNSYSYNNGQVNISEIFSSEPYEGNDFPIEYDKQILSAPKGTVVGPFSDGQNVLMVKIRETGTREEAKARNIFFSTSGMEDNLITKKRKTLDSLFRIIKADTSKFSELASLYSDDFISRDNNATHNWFPKGKIHAGTKFESFCFEKPVGSFQIVETENGLHILQLLGRKMNEYKLIAVVDTKITASKETGDSIYANMALPIYNNIKSLGFEQAVEEAGLIPLEAKNIRIDYPEMNGLPKNMNIIKWAFNSKVGTVMEPEKIEGNTKLIIAYLTEAIHEGDPEFESIKSLMEPEVIKEKKVIYLSNLIGTPASIEDAAIKTGAMVSNADLTLSMNNFPSQQGEEPGVIGQVFALEQGVVSPVIKGDKGVYVATIENKSIPEASDDISSYKNTITEDLRTQVGSVTGGRLILALYNASEAKDWRMKRTILNR